MEITSIEFKSKCLELIDQVNDSHEEVVITKNGSPVAKLVPYGDEDNIPVSLFGYMKNSVEINGDIVSPIDEKWVAEV